MNRINSDFVDVETLDDGSTVSQIFLADDPDKCVFGDIVTATDADGTAIDFRFPANASGVAAALLKDVSGLTLVGQEDALPYDEVVGHFERTGSICLIGRSSTGRFFIHCKLPGTHSLLVAV